LWGAEGRRQKAEGRRQKAEGRRQKAEGRRQKAEGRRQKANFRAFRGKHEKILSRQYLSSVPGTRTGSAGIDRAGVGLIDRQYVEYGIKLSRRIQSSIWMIFLVSKGMKAHGLYIRGDRLSTSPDVQHFLLTDKCECGNGPNPTALNLQAHQNQRSGQTGHFRCVDWSC
jgi:hypothetical protein